MAMITKVELVQINSRLASENAALRAQVSQLSADLANMASVASAVNTMHKPYVKAAYVMPQWQLDRKAAMEAARAEAVRTGHMVRA